MNEKQKQKLNINFQYYFFPRMSGIYPSIYFSLIISQLNQALAECNND